MNENMKAYGVASHRHTPEIEEQLGYAGNCQVTINFTPHLVPMNRGILATEYATLKRKPDGTLPTYEEVKAVYDKYYANEKFVRVLDKAAAPRPSGWKAATTWTSTLSLTSVPDASL